MGTICHRAATCVAANYLKQYRLRRYVGSAAAALVAATVLVAGGTTAEPLMASTPIKDLAISTAIQPATLVAGFPAAAVPPVQPASGAEITPPVIATVDRHHRAASIADFRVEALPAASSSGRLRPVIARGRGVSPAERLGLKGKARAAAETCLAAAIYFEARGEDVRGQVAVAQVVMNRVFSKFYPHSICGVVYQNAERYHGCQFSFACNHKAEVITEPGAWSLAQHLAEQTLDGNVWDPEIGRATHYHATFVNPSWTGEMRKVASYGIHVFYRPLTWGDGADEPNWSRVTHTHVAVLN